MKASASPLKSASHHNTAVRPERASHLQLVRTRGGMGRARARLRDSTHQLDVVGSKKHLQQPNSIHQARLNNHSPGSHPRDGCHKSYCPPAQGPRQRPGRLQPAGAAEAFPFGCGAALRGQREDAFLPICVTALQLPRPAGGHQARQSSSTF